MKKFQNKKGFTLAELLIVVAIIAVLVAISIPIFTTQLEKSRDAVTVANLRAAYAEAAVDVLGDTDTLTATKTIKDMGTQSGFEDNIQTDLPFSITDTAGNLGKGAGADVTVEFDFSDPANVTCTVQ